MSAPRDFRFLLRPKWAIGTLLILAVAVTMVELGFWQIRRLHQTLQRRAAIERRMDAPPQPLARILQRYDTAGPLYAPNSADYRKVTATGRYDPSAEVLLRSRSRGGHPGFHVLTPLVLADGKALLVDRGWVPFIDSDPPVPAAAPPSGQVTVTGLLRRPAPEPSGPFKAISPQDPATGPLKKTFYANPHRLQAQMPFPLIDAYLWLGKQDPPQPGALPALPEPPKLDSGATHVSYAIQWFGFMVIGVIGYSVNVLRRSRERPEQEEGGPEPVADAEGRPDAEAAGSRRAV